MHNIIQFLTTIKSRAFTHRTHIHACTPIQAKPPLCYPWRLAIAEPNEHCYKQGQLPEVLGKDLTILQWQSKSQACKAISNGFVAFDSGPVQQNPNVSSWLVLWGRANEWVFTIQQPANEQNGRCPITSQPNLQTATVAHSQGGYVDFQDQAIQHHVVGILQRRRLVDQASGAWKLPALDEEQIPNADLASASFILSISLLEGTPYFLCWRREAGTAPSSFWGYPYFHVGRIWKREPKNAITVSEATICWWLFWTGKKRDRHQFWGPDACTASNTQATVQQPVPGVPWRHREWCGRCCLGLGRIGAFPPT